MKDLWIYVLVAANGLLPQPIALTSGKNENECFKRGAEIVSHPPYSKENLMARCVPNSEVDELFPTLRWL